MDKSAFVAELARSWKSPRWEGITRSYTPDDVWRVRGTVQVDHTLARRGAAGLWRLLHDEPYVHTLSAITGGQAVMEPVRSIGSHPSSPTPKPASVATSMPSSS